MRFQSPLRLLLFCLLVGAPAVALADGETPPHRSDLSDDDARLSYTEWLSKLQLAGLLGPQRGAGTGPSEVERESTGNGRAKLIVRGSVRLDIDVGSRRVTRFWNSVGFEALWTDQRRWERIYPRWTKEHALKRAQEVILLFLRSDDVVALQLRGRSPTFLETGDQRGIWEISWCKQLNGYPFERNGVEVALHEEYGLINFGSADISDDCPTRVELRRAEALKRAQELVNQAFSGLTWDTVAEGVLGLRQRELLWHPGLSNGSLIIVQPNAGFEEWGGVGAKLATTDRATRLAFVVDFDSKEGREAAPGNDAITVYVDAEDGRIIGGSWPPELGDYYRHR